MSGERTIRCVLVDDEPPAIDELSYLLSAFAGVEVVGTAASAGQALEVIAREEPDVAFLDIQMPGASGFEASQALLTLPRPPLLVFATAYDEHAIRAFEENAVDYILKPVSRDRLAKTVDRLREILARGGGRRSGSGVEDLLRGMGIGPELIRVSVEVNGRVLLLKHGEVVFFRSSDRRVMAHTASAAHPVHGSPTLDRIEERLKGLPFFRANRGELVNLAQVRDFAPWFNGKYVLTMRDAEQTEITVSKGRARLFRERLGLD